MEEVYSEVYEILNLLGKEYIKKLPREVYDYIDNSRNKKSTVTFDLGIALESQNISEDALFIIDDLNKKYF